MHSYARERAVDQIASVAARGLDLRAFWDAAAEAVSSIVPHCGAPCWFTRQAAAIPAAGCGTTALLVASAEVDDHSFSRHPPRDLTPEALVGPRHHRHLSYLAFETKGGVVRALWNLRLRGERDDVPIAQQRWYREVLDEHDPERQLLRAATRPRGTVELIQRSTMPCRGQTVTDARSPHVSRLATYATSTTSTTSSNL